MDYLIEPEKKLPLVHDVDVAVAGGGAAGFAAAVAAHRKPPNIRGRESVMMMGQAAGTAAALCARQDLYRRQLDVRQLQQALVDAGINLGPKERLDALLNNKGKK